MVAAVVATLLPLVPGYGAVTLLLILAIADARGGATIDALRSLAHGGA